MLIKASVVRCLIFYLHSISVYLCLLYCLYIFCHPQRNERDDEQHGHMLRCRARSNDLEIWACSARARERALLCAGMLLAEHSFGVDMHLIEVGGLTGAAETSKRKGEETGPSFETCACTRGFSCCMR